jgi:hypothetical protein
MALQIRRGTNAERLTITPLQGELLFTTDTKNLYVGDGTTQGGVVIEGGGSSASNAFSSIAVAGQSTVGADSSEDTLTLIAGSNVTITTNATNDSITIASTAGATNLDALTDVIISSPNVDQVLKYNGTSWVNGAVSSGGGGIAELVEDISPQLGGNLDLNNNDITGAGDVNIGGNVIATEIKVSGALTPSIRMYESAGNQGTITSRDNDSDIRFVARRLTIGDSVTDGQLRVFSINKSGAETLSLRTYNNSSSASNELALSRSRGTGDIPVAVQNADIIYRMYFNGHDGTTFIPSAQIFSEVSGTVATGQVPGALKFSTADSLGVMRNALTIGSDQVVEANFGITVGSGDLLLKNTNPRFQSAQNDQSAKVLSFSKSRGTLVTPTAIQANDYIYTLRFNGDDGAAEQTAVQVRAEAGATVGTGIVSGKLRVITNDSTGLGKTAMLIDEEQMATFFYGVTLGGNGDLRLVNANANVEAYSLAQTTKIMEFKRARGTTDVPLTVEPLDHLYSLRFNGYTGAGGYGAAAIIRGEVQSTVSTGIVSGKLRFMTANTSGVMTTALEVDEQQQTRISAGGLLVANAPSAFTFNADTLATNGVAFNRSRGTITAPLVSESGDYIYIMRFNGHDGTNYVQAAQIRAEVASAPSTGAVPGRLRFAVNDAAGAMQNLLTLGGVATFFTEVKHSTTTTSTTRTHTISAADRLVENGNYVGYTQLVTGVAEVFSAFFYSAATNRGAKLTITVSRGTGDVRVQEVLIANDGSTVTSAAGTPLTRGTDPISAVSVIVNAGNVVLRLTTDTGNTAGDITKVTIQATVFRA